MQIQPTVSPGPLDDIIAQTGTLAAHLHAATRVPRRRKQNAMKRILSLTILAALATGGYLAVKFLPWWALLLGFVALVVVGKFVAAKILTALLTLPFKAKGAVLRGATAQVNSVVPVTSSDESNNVHYQVDVTITPAETTGAFNLWAPGELRFGKPGTKVDSSDGDVGEIETVEVEQDGQFVSDEGLKYSGVQRLKLRISVPPGTTVLKFRYYFEEFGELRFGNPAAKAA